MVSSATRIPIGCSPVTTDLIEIEYLKAYTMCLGQAVSRLLLTRVLRGQRVIDLLLTNEIPRKQNVLIMTDRHIKESQLCTILIGSPLHAVADDASTYENADCGTLKLIKKC